MRQSAFIRNSKTLQIDAKIGIKTSKLDIWAKKLGSFIQGYTAIFMQMSER